MLDVGATIGDYRLEERIGRGGMGVVFRATQLSLDRPVALKVITPDLAEDASFRERFKREARLAAQIDHPNVVPVYQADEQDGQLYIAMRYVPGTDLRAFATSRGLLPAPEAVRIVEQVAAALDAAHEQGLVHRDVKPANVLLSGRAGAEHVYLTDFGLTKRISSGESLTHTGTFVGTLDYIAPEQLRGGPVDCRADIYALGCVLYELLTAMVPFERDSDAAKLYAHISDPPPRPSEVVPALSRAFDAVVRKAMAKDPQGRHETAGELAAAARAAISGDLADEAPTLISTARTTSTPRPPPPLPEQRARVRRGPSRRLGALAAVCVAGAVAAIIGFASGGPSGAGASEAHEQAVAVVCQQSNRVQDERMQRLAAFEQRLKRLGRLESTRDHILNEVQLRLSASTDLRTRLEAAPPAPDAKVAAQRDTLSAWERNLRRLQVHRNALSEVRTYRGLFRVLGRQPRVAIEADATKTITGLRRLGGSSCDLDPLRPDPIVRVKRPRGKKSEPVLAAPTRPAVAPPTPEAAPPALPPAAPPPVAPPPALPPPQSIEPEEQPEQVPPSPDPTAPPPPATPPAAPSPQPG